MSSRFTCVECKTEWVHSPSAVTSAAGSLVLALASAAALAMLWFLLEDNTTAGGGLALGALAAMGLGVWLRGRATPRCAECTRHGVPVDESA